MKKLIIGLDAGFDSVKVTIGDVFYKLPFNAIEVDLEKIIQHKTSDEMIITEFNNKTFLVGKYARQLIYNYKNKEEILRDMESFYTSERFTTLSFKVTLLTALYMAIEKYKKEQGLYDISEYEIIVNVALPHRLVQNFKQVIVDSIGGLHKFKVKIGTGEFEDVVLNIKKENIGTISQTLSALIAITTDDDCYENEEEQKLLDGPTLVVDIGFYTVGLVEIVNGIVLDEKTDSNTKFAMKNVYQKIEEELKDKREDIKVFNIEYLLNANPEIKYKDKDDNVHKVDLFKLKEEKTKEVIAEFIKFLNKTYNNLLDIKYLVITGGGGAWYYSDMSKYFIEKGILEKNQVILTKGTLYDKTWESDFAISVGAYKAGKVAFIQKI